MRAVLDPNVVISAALSRQGRRPGSCVRGSTAPSSSSCRRWSSPNSRAPAYPKLRKRIPPEDAAGLIESLRRSATVADDPAGAPPLASPDPGDDYLIALAVSERAALVSGDRHLLSIGPDLPIYAPADFLLRIEPDPS